MNSPQTPTPALPGWARTLAEFYESNAASQFVIYGNISDRMVLPGPPAAHLGALPDFLLGVLLSRFDVVLSYDLGNGIRVDKGGIFKRAKKTGKRPVPRSRRSRAIFATAPT
jgi:hypothetical protein